MARTASFLSLLPLVLATGGCVERSFIVETNPPGALVLVNNKPLGAAPTDGTWVYAGNYRFTLYHEGYETLHVDQPIEPRWYDYPGLDFVADFLWPFKIVDRRVFRYELSPARVPDVSEVLERSGILRQRGQGLRSGGAPQESVDAPIYPLGPGETAVPTPPPLSGLPGIRN